MRMGRVWVVLVMVAGCQSGPPVEEGNLDQTFHRTVVIGHDGTQSVYQSTITRREQLAELEQRQQWLRSGVAAVSQDPSCLGSDMWLFDQANRVGNEICFSGLGTADLRSYVRIPGIATWSGGVRSFWAGTYGGFFGVWPNGSLFYTFEAANTVDSIVSSSRYLTFSNHPIDMAQ